MKITTGITSDWVGVQMGAEVYKYEQSYFGKLLREGRIFGAIFMSGHWQANPEGLVQAIPDVPTNYILPPMSGMDATFEHVEGVVSGACYSRDLRLDLQHPHVVLRAHPGCSGELRELVTTPDARQG